MECSFIWKTKVSFHFLVNLLLTQLLLPLCTTSNNSSLGWIVVRKHGHIRKYSYYYRLHTLKYFMNSGIVNTILKCFIYFFYNEHLILTNQINITSWYKLLIWKCSTYWTENMKYLHIHFIWMKVQIWIST